MAVERENDRELNGYKVYDARIRQGDTERTEVRAVLKRSADGNYATADERFIAVKESPTCWVAYDNHTDTDLGEADRLSGVKVLIARAISQAQPTTPEPPPDAEGVSSPTDTQPLEDVATEDDEDGLGEA